MRKLLLFFTFFVLSPSGFTQIFDEEVISNACNCIYNAPGDSIDSIVNSCLMKSLLYSLEKDGTITGNKLPESFTEEEAGTRVTFGQYQEMLYKICYAPSLLVQKKQNRYYKMPDSEEATRFYLQGTELEKEGDFERAIEAFKTSLLYDSLAVNTLDQAGAVFRKLNDWNKAREYSLKSLQIFPEGYYGLINIGETCLASEDSQGALAAYIKLVKYYQKNAEGYFGLARISFSSADYPGAIRLLKQAYSLLPENDTCRAREMVKYFRQIYFLMKESGSDALFREEASEFIPGVYQPKDFIQLESLELNNEIDCRLAEPQILVCADYILSTPVDTSNATRTLAIAALKKWFAKTPHYVFHIDKSVAEVLDPGGNVMNLFITAMSEFCIENPEKGNDRQAIDTYAWTTVLKYAGNKANKVPLTEQMKKRIKAQEKTTKKK